MFFSKNKKKAPLHTEFKCEVSFINFTENKLIITISTNGQEGFNDSTTNLTIKNMNDAEKKYNFSLTQTGNAAIHTEIDLSEIPFIKEEGKWSIYYTINHKEFRLSPTESLVTSIADSKKFVHGALLTEPYITVKENISFRTVKNPNKPEKKKVTSYVTSLDGADGVFRITGTVDENNQDRLGALLSIQKRNTSLSYQFPLQWNSEGTWNAAIDFNCNDFSNGTWDYYIEYKKKKNSNQTR